MHWDDRTSEWETKYRDGQAQTTKLIRTKFAIVATGQLNTPSRPNIQGLDSFAGEMLHSAEWRDVQLENKNVTVLGTGASAIQIVPAIAQHVTPKRHQKTPPPKKRIPDLCR